MKTTTKTTKLDITIDGNNYTLSCPEYEKEYVCLLAQKVDKIVADVKSTTGPCSVSSLLAICMIKMQDEIEKKEKIVSEAIDKVRKSSILIENESCKKVEQILESMTSKIERIINDIIKDIEGNC